MSRVGEKLKDAREKLGLSQKQLAKKLGVAESFINDVELGRKILNENMLTKISKVVGKEINDVNMSIEEEVDREQVELRTESPRPNKIIMGKTSTKDLPEVNDQWSNALSSVLKSVPIYKYNLNEVVGSRQLPVISNKIEGYSQDKAMYLLIENDDMLGFRIAEGDIAFSHLTHEVQNNGICLLEINSERVIRQIKKLDNSKVLLISNKGSLRTETAYIKDINVIAKLERIEIKL